MTLDDLDGGAMEVDGAAVVAEAFPRTHDIADRRGGTGRGIGEAVEERLPAGHDARHLGLLQHELADEDGPRITRAPPREVATVGRGPAQEGVLHQKTSVT